MSKTGITTYREMQPNGDELVSEYGIGWQRAYAIPKALLDYRKREAARLRKPTDSQANTKPSASKPQGIQRGTDK